MSPALAAVMLAGATIVASRVFAGDDDREFFALLLAFVAAVYVGAAYADGRPAVLLVEAAAAAGFVTLAVLGNRRFPPLLVLGFVAHGLWDAAHRADVLDTAVAAGYPDLCLVYDVVIGVYALLRLHAWPTGAGLRRPS